MKKISFAIFIISFLVLLVTLSIFFTGRQPIQKVTFYASANISLDRVIGFDVNSTALSFGKISLGTGITRNVIFKNDYPFPLTVLINSNGRIGDLLSFEQIEYIQSGEEKKIPFNVLVSSEAEEGFYDGNVSFELYRDKVDI